MAKKAYIGVGNFDKRNLPSGYTQVEYIQSSGTQYIDTGFAPNQDTRVVCRTLLPLNSKTNWLFGSRYSTDERKYAFAASSANYYSAHYNTVNPRFDKTLTPAGVFTVDFNKQNIGIIADGVTYTTTSTPTYAAFDTPSSMLLFACITGGSVACGSSAIYGCQIYDNGNLIRDYVPCTNASGVAGLYDLVGNAFYQNAGTGTFATGTSTHQSFARKIKGGYVGVDTEVPIYKDETRTVNITASNMAEVFGIYNSTYYFAGVGSTFTSNNKSIAGSSANTILTAKYDMTISFKYSYSSEANYDQFTLKVGSTTVENQVSGSTTTKTYSGSVKAGDKIEFLYQKDGSQNSNNDQCTFSDMVVTAVFKTQTGTEVKPLARKIKKAYIGIGGVARPCLGAGELAYYGKVTSLGAARRRFAAASIGNYALFAGGDGNSKDSAAVDIYDKSLTHQYRASELVNAREGLAATSNDNYAIFACGYYGSYTGKVDVYDKSLVHSLPGGYLQQRDSLSACTVGEYAVFAGGLINDTVSTAIVEAYNNSLTRMDSVSSLTLACASLAAAYIGGRALFAGGRNSSNKYSSYVDAYDASLTRSSLSNLSVARYSLFGASNKKYAIFAGGWSADPSTDAYDESLTRVPVRVISEGQSYGAGASLGEYALIGGGYNSTGTVYAYDLSLTQTTPMSGTDLNGNLAAATVGDFALFGGGAYSGVISSVHAITIA